MECKYDKLHQTISENAKVRQEQKVNFYMDLIQQCCDRAIQDGRTRFEIIINTDSEETGLDSDALVAKIEKLLEQNCFYVCKRDWRYTGIVELTAKVGPKPAPIPGLLTKLKDWIIG